MLVNSRKNVTLVCVCDSVTTDIEEQLGTANCAAVYGLYDYAAHNADELSFQTGDEILILCKGDDFEKDWWWASLQQKEGYIPRNYIGVSKEY